MPFSSIFECLTRENVDNPFFIHHLDRPGVVLVSNLLTSSTYNSWHYAMTMARSVKNKLSMINDSISKPSFSDSQFSAANKISRGILIAPQLSPL